MRKRKLNLYVKPLIGSLISLSVLLFIIICLIQLAKKSDFFRVKQVLVKINNTAGGDYKIDLSYLIGRNIITLALNREEERILKLYPGYGRINLIRILPDKLCAIFIPRKAVALLKLYRHFCLDEDLVLFIPANEQECAGLVEICGLETKIFGPKSGTRYNCKELNTALTIIKAVKNNPMLTNIQIKKFDLSEPANTTFFITKDGQDVKPVRISQEAVVDKINILGSVLAQAGNDWPDIKYIDLRFKEPVIKLEQ